MNITEVIKELEKIKKEHGDLEVNSKWVDMSLRQFVPAFFRIQHVRILKGREHKRISAYSWDPPERIGKKILVL